MASNEVADAAARLGSTSKIEIFTGHLLARNPVWPEPATTGHAAGRGAGNCLCDTPLAVLSQGESAEDGVAHLSGVDHVVAAQAVGEAIGAGALVAFHLGLGLGVELG